MRRTPRTEELRVLLVAEVFLAAGEALVTEGREDLLEVVELGLSPRLPDRHGFDRLAS